MPWAPHFTPQTQVRHLDQQHGCNRVSSLIFGLEGFHVSYLVMVQVMTHDLYTSYSNILTVICLFHSLSHNILLS